jgi:hypothetical protein
MLGNAIKVDDTVVDRLLVRVVLADAEPFRNRLQAFLKAVHFKIKKG